MASVVFGLCALTSSICAMLLYRAHRRNGGSLLFMSSLCFLALAINNIILFADLVVVPEMDLSVIRSSIAVGGLAVMVFGLLWETA